MFHQIQSYDGGSLVLYFLRRVHGLLRECDTGPEVTRPEPLSWGRRAASRLRDSPLLSLTRRGRTAPAGASPVFAVISSSDPSRERAPVVTSGPPGEVICRSPGFVLPPDVTRPAGRAPPRRAPAPGQMAAAAAAAAVGDVAKPRVYRLRRLPRDADRLRVIQILCRSMDGVAAEDVCIGSLADTVNPWEEPTKTATLTFKRPPSALEGKGKNFELAVEVVGLKRPLLLDAHFRGFTPLNDVVPGMHEYE